MVVCEEVDSPFLNIISLAKSFTLTAAYFPASTVHPVLPYVLSRRVSPSSVRLGATVASVS